MPKVPTQHVLILCTICSHILQGFINYLVPRFQTYIMLNSTENEISTANKKLKYLQMEKFIALSLSDFVFIMLVNDKMPTIDGILTFMSRINSCSAELIMEQVL